MSDHTTINRFCKSGDLHYLSRRFHGLGRIGKLRSICLIQAGIDPKKAVAAAKRFETKLAVTGQPLLAGV